MRLLLDQNVPVAVTPFLRALRPSWTIAHVNEVGLRGASDSRILYWARTDAWVVLTFDEDFADARMFPIGTHAGVIRLRVWPTTVEECQSALLRLLEQVPEGNWPGSLIIVDFGRIRIRRAIRHG